MLSRTIGVLVLATAFLGLSCGVGKKSPAEVVQAAYTAANDGDYSTAGEYLSAEIIHEMESMVVLTGGMKNLWDETTRNGTIDHVEILEESIRGEGANVRFRIHYKDGSTMEDHESLLKENGDWKITAG